MGLVGFAIWSFSLLFFLAILKNSANASLLIKVQGLCACHLGKQDWLKYKILQNYL